LIFSIWFRYAVLTSLSPWIHHIGGTFTKTIDSSPGTPLTPYRYIAYTSQIGTILHSARKYASRACSMTEHVRSAERLYLTRGVSAISWVYAVYDVVFEGHQAYLRNRDILAPPSKAFMDARDSNIRSIAKYHAMSNAPRSSAHALGSQSVGWGDDDDGADSLEPWPVKHVPLADDYRVVMAKRAIFHGLASIGLPTFTIHRIVKYSGGYFKGRNTLLARSCMPLGVSFPVLPQRSMANLVTLSSVYWPSHFSPISSTGLFTTLWR
jgi:fission process protein 1